MISTLREDPKLRDFRNFLILAWRFLRLPDPTPVQLGIAEWIARGPSRNMTKGFRGIGKSWIASVFTCWNWAMNPDSKILVVSGGAQRAADFTTFTRQLIEGWPVLADLRPGINALRDSKLAFDVSGASLAHAPSIKSIGITGQLTGSRADVIIADDIETQSNSDTPGKREKVAAYFREFSSILSPGGIIRILGTDMSEEALYRQLPAMGYVVRVWPAEYPRSDLVAALGDTLAPEIRDAVRANPALEGQATDPTRFPSEVLRDKEVELGRSHYRLQFLLDPRMSDMERFPLRLSDLIVLPTDPATAPERVTYGMRVGVDIPCIGFSGDRYWSPAHLSDRWLPYQGTILAVDPAGRGRDETAAAVLGQLNGFLYLLELRSWLNEGYDDAVLEALAKMAATYRVASVVVEANFGDGMFARLLEPHLGRSGHHCAVEEVKHAVQKERRIIDTLEPLIQQHRLVVNTQVLLDDLRPIPGLTEAAMAPYRLAYQLSRITRDRGSLQRDDRVDALAIGAAWWRDAMAQDAAVRQAQKHEQDILAEMERFERHAINPLGPSRPEPRPWLQQVLGRPGPRPAPLGRPAGPGRATAG